MALLSLYLLGTFRVVARRRGLKLTVTAPKHVRLPARPTVAVTLREPSGRPAAGATVRWRLYRQGDAPPPPGQQDFRFGRALGPAVTPSGDSADDLAWPDEAVWVSGGVQTTDAKGGLTIRPSLTAPPAMAGAALSWWLRPRR